MPGLRPSSLDLSIPFRQLYLRTSHLYIFLNKFSIIFVRSSYRFLPILRSLVHSSIVFPIY